jgi:hypothetical protein
MMGPSHLGVLEGIHGTDNRIADHRSEDPHEQ